MGPSGRSKSSKGEGGLQSASGKRGRADKLKRRQSVHMRKSEASFKEGFVNRASVRSRDIAIVGYDDDTSTLEIAFRSGGVYRYWDVPRDVYVSLMSSPSHGIYFSRNIRRNFAFAKVR